MTEEESKKDKIFRLICWNDNCIMNPGIVLSTKALAVGANVSYYYARKYCKELESEGLIKFKREYVPDQFSYEGEWEQEAFWNIGWETTEKALETRIWKEEQAEEERLRKECWGD